MELVERYNQVFSKEFHNLELNCFIDEIALEAGIEEEAMRELTKQSIYLATREVIITVEDCPEDGTYSIIPPKNNRVIECQGVRSEIFSLKFTIEGDNTTIQLNSSTPVGPGLNEGDTVDMNIKFWMPIDILIRGNYKVVTSREGSHVSN